MGFSLRARLVFLGFSKMRSTVGGGGGWGSLFASWRPNLAVGILAGKRGPTLGPKVGFFCWKGGQRLGFSGKMPILDF